MSWLPDTASKGKTRRWPGWTLAVLGIVGAVLIFESLFRSWSFSPGEELAAPGFTDVVVSAEDALYPPADVGRFEKPPEAVHVYLILDGTPGSGEEIEVRAERTRTGSLLSMFLPESPGEDIVALEEERPASGERSRPAGIVEFALKTRSGEPLPPGRYTISIGREGADGPAVRKFFVVQG